MKNTRTALRQIRVGMVTLTRTFTENSFESDMLILDMLSIWGVEGDCLRVYVSQVSPALLGSKVPPVSASLNG